MRLLFNMRMKRVCFGERYDVIWVYCETSEREYSYNHNDDDGDDDDDDVGGNINKQQASIKHKLLIWFQIVRRVWVAHSKYAFDGNCVDGDEESGIVAAGRGQPWDGSHWKFMQIVSNITWRTTVQFCVKRITSRSEFSDAIILYQ